MFELKIDYFFSWNEKSLNHLLSTNLLRTDHPFNPKLWLMYFFTIMFPFYMQKQNFAKKKVECYFNTIYFTKGNNYQCGQKKFIISSSGTASLHFHMPHLLFYSVLVNKHMEKRLIVIKNAASHLGRKKIKPSF